jgi:hypothetical protein
MSPELKLQLAAAAEANPMHRLLQSLNGQAQIRELSTKQLAMLSDILDQLRQDANRLADVPPLSDSETPCRLMGEIIRLKTVTGRFGTRLKMTVQLNDGNRVYSTVPAAWVSTVRVAMRIIFDGTVKVCDSDPHFGFVSFPKPVKQI